MKKFRLKLDEVEKEVFVQKTTDEDGSPAIKVWFLHDDGEEQSATMGYKKKWERNESWKKLDANRLTTIVDHFLTLTNVKVSFIEEVKDE